MILHIATDEKFIDTGFRVFEEVNPGGNKFIVITSEDKVNFVKKSIFEKRTRKELSTKEFSKYVEGFSAVVLHSLSFLNIRLPTSVKVLWIGFGFDYYDLIYKKPNSLLLPKTTESKESLNKYVRFKTLLKKYPFFWMINRLITGDSSKLKVIDKIDFFAPVLNSEYDLVANAVPNFKPNFIDWNYGTLEDDLLKGFEKKTIIGNNILIGNSAAYENNHLETFQLLRLLDIKDRDLIYPLSYGSLENKNEVLRIGDNLFGDKFNALTNFMPIDEYINTLSSCSILIMNHIRQQGLGNIIIMLYLGAKVFLRKENPIYTFFKNEGAKIYSIEDLELNKALIVEKITEDELLINRNILRKYWSRNVIQEKTKILIDKITS